MKFDFPSIIYDVPCKDAIVAKYGKRMSEHAYKVAMRIHLRTRVGEAQNWKCCWCGCDTIISSNKKNSATLEHVNPSSQGGKDEWENYAMACYSCNTRRGVTSVEDFMNNILTKKMSGVNQKTRRQERRLRSVRRKAQKMQDRSWMRNGVHINPQEWVLSITRCKVIQTEILTQYT